jgi:hypothetical protein
MKQYGIEPGTPLANQVFNRPTILSGSPPLAHTPYLFRLGWHLGLQLRCEFFCGLLREIFAIAVAFFIMPFRQFDGPRRMLPAAVRAATCQEPHSVSIQRCWKSIQPPLGLALDSRPSNEAA